jgi:D-alanine-D-alanine ligase
VHLNIGIAYDTPDMYNLGNSNDLYYDFSELASINVLKQEIESLGHQTELLGNTENIMQLIRDRCFSCDLVYNTVEGLKSRNREGFLPSLLEMHHIPYIGTDAFGLSLALDKTLTKILAEYLHILTPNYFVATPHYSQDIIYENLENMKYPMILKPNYEGNSSGICVCNSVKSARSEVSQLLKKYQSNILCEEFIFGREITVPIIGNNLDDILYGITTVNIQKSDDFWLDVNCKVFGDYRNIILDVSNEIKEKFKTISLKMFQAIGCRDFARFDFRMTRDNEIYFIEVNPLPALFKGGSFDIIGQQYGYSFSETIQLIISNACKRLSIPKT